MIESGRGMPARPGEGRDPMHLLMRLIAALRQAHEEARDRRLFNQIQDHRAARRAES